VTGLSGPSQIAESTTSEGIGVAFATMGGMSITPASGTYLVWFSGNFAGDAANTLTITYKIRAGGVDVAASVKQQFINAVTGEVHESTTIARVTVNGAQAVDVQAMTDIGTPTVESRQLMIAATS
jgi:hypothetical protein